MWTDILLQNRQLEAAEENDDSDDDEEDANSGPLAEADDTEESKRQRLIMTLMEDVASFAEKSSRQGSSLRSPANHTIAQPSHSDIKGYPCYSVMKKLYLNSCRRLRTCLKKFDIRYNDSKSFHKSSLSRLTESIAHLQTSLAESRYDDAQAKEEFATFQQKCKEQRSHAAMLVAEALQHLTDISHAHHEAYEAAKLAFETRSKLNIGFVSATGRHITSDAKMDDIKRKADEAQSQQGLRIQELQAAETALLLKLR